MTFSIVARCSRTLALGVAVSTAVPAVGSVVPHVKVNVGAIATQAQTSIAYGKQGLQLLENGLVPQKALRALLAADKDREKRQVIIVDAKGKTAAHTGKETEDWKGHAIDYDCVVAGNMLTGSNVVRAMLDSFKDRKGSLAPLAQRA